MDGYSAHLKAIQTWFLFFLSFCLAAWAVAAGLRPWFAGLMLGSLASYINARHLAWKVNRVGEAAASGRTKRVTLSFLTRAAIAALACAVALRYPVQFSFSTTVAGLFFTQLATLAMGIVASCRRSRK
jgi:ATP synthase protein I